MNLPEISRSMLKNSVILGLFAVFTVGLVAITQQGTAERIASAEREAKARALSEILPAGSYDNHLLDNSIQLHDPLLGSKSPQTAYIALKDGQPSAVILRATAPDGYSGDEDNGQTSAWYVFSALGFYPVTPGVPEYVIGSPLFNAVTLTLPQGKQLQINALNNQQDRPFVQALQFNGQPVEQNFLRHNELLQGGELRFDMSATPNTSRGVNEQSRPYSVSTAAEATTMADSHLNKDTH